MKLQTITKSDLPQKTRILSLGSQLLIIIWSFIILWVYWVGMGMPGINILSLLVLELSKALVAINQFNNVVLVNFYNLSVSISQFLIQYFSAVYLQ